MKHPKFYPMLLNIASEAFNSLFLFQEQKCSLKLPNCTMLADIIFIDSTTTKVMVNTSGNATRPKYELVDYSQLTPFYLATRTVSRLSLENHLPYYRFGIGESFDLDIFRNTRCFCISGLEVRDAILKHQQFPNENPTASIDTIEVCKRETTAVETQTGKSTH